MIAIVGNGSIGLTLGAVFSKAGMEVRIVTRRPVEAKYIEAEGVLSGRFKAEFSTSIGSPEAVIVAVKAYHLSSLAPKLVRLEVPVMFIQNGLDILELVRPYVKRPVRALTGIGAYRLSPNRVHVAGLNITRIGETPNGDHEVFVRLREKAGLKYIIDDPVVAERRKAALNAGINPVTAILRVKNGELLKLPALETSLAALREAVNVAEAYGIRLENMEEMLIRGLERTAENYSSMAMDVMHKRPTEIDFINGKIVEKARNKGLEAPVNETLRRLVKSIEAQYTDTSRQGRCSSC